MENALDFLIEQAQSNEKSAINAIAKARAELDNYYQQVAQIEQYRLDYCQQLVEKGQAGLTASQFMHLNRFLTQLDETLTKQKQAESHFKQQVESAQQHWHQVRQQRRSYQVLQEKKQQEKQHQEQKKEQTMMDEFAALAYRKTLF